MRIIFMQGRRAQRNETQSAGLSYKRKSAAISSRQKNIVCCLPLAARAGTRRRLRSAQAYVLLCKYFRYLTQQEYNTLFSAGFRNRKEMIERLCESLLFPGPIDYSVTCDDEENSELLDIKNIE